MVNYQCDLCGKTFKQKGHHTRHRFYKKKPCVNLLISDHNWLNHKPNLTNITPQKAELLIVNWSQK
jgi:hypothetical protein